MGANPLLQFEHDGYLLLKTFLPPGECDRLAEELTSLFEEQTQGPDRPRGGLRNVLRLSASAMAFATSPPVVSLVGGLLDGPPFPVRAILFDKTEAANWGVPWHQDLAIAVAERIETPGFGAWSVKEGVLQVKPPPEILAQMVTLRLHLDDCGADNGALRVLPGTHLGGELNADTIASHVAAGAPEICETSKGGALLMRPLLLHASAAARKPSHRRVLHVEYASIELPNGLKWSERT